jgi:hypothetical protein
MGLASGRCTCPCSPSLGGRSGLGQPGHLTGIGLRDHSLSSPAACRFRANCSTISHAAPQGKGVRFGSRTSPLDAISRARAREGARTVSETVLCQAQTVASVCRFVHSPRSRPTAALTDGLEESTTPAATATFSCPSASGSTSTGLRPDAAHQPRAARRRRRGPRASRDRPPGPTALEYRCATWTECSIARASRTRDGAATLTS